MSNMTAFLARGLALLWAGFWLFFFVVESLAWHTPLATMAWWVGAGLLFLLLAAIAWRWEVEGGVLLVAVGAIATVAYVTWSPAGLAAWVRFVTAVTLGVPAIISGMLFLAHHHAVSRRTA